jgi:hypothetical protein
MKMTEPNTEQTPMGALKNFVTAKLLKDCSSAGVTVTLDAACNLKVSGTLTDELRLRLRASKADVIAYLSPEANYPQTVDFESLNWAYHDRACLALARIWRMQDADRSIMAMNKLNELSPEPDLSKPDHGLPPQEVEWLKRDLEVCKKGIPF